MNGDDTKRLFEAIGRIEALVGNAGDNLERHRRETREDVKTIHQRIDKVRDETKRIFSEQAERIEVINQRHAEEDGSARARRGIRMTIFGFSTGVVGAGATKLFDWLGK